MAVTSFNVPSLEALRAAVDAAEQTHFPVILSHAEGHEAIVPMDDIAPAMVAAGGALLPSVRAGLLSGRRSWARAITVIPVSWAMARSCIDTSCICSWRSPRTVGFISCT